MCVTAFPCVWVCHTAVLGLYFSTAGTSVSQCVGVCWSVLECVGVCWSALECVGVRWSALECVGVYWSVLACVGVCWEPATVSSGVLFAS